MLTDMVVLHSAVCQPVSTCCALTFESQHGALAIDAMRPTHGPMSDVNLALSPGFNSIIAGIEPSPNCAWTLCASIRCMPCTTKVAVQQYAYCCSSQLPEYVADIAVLKKCLLKVRASLDCEHLRTSCCPNVPADTGISISRSGLPEQELHCPCRTACIQIMPAESVFCHQSCAHSPHAFLDSSTFKAVTKQ
jgi:hypothetical protein